MILSRAIALPFSLKQHTLYLSPALFYQPPPQHPHNNIWLLGRSVTHWKHTYTYTYIQIKKTSGKVVTKISLVTHKVERGGGTGVVLPWANTPRRDQWVDKPVWFSTRVWQGSPLQCFRFGVTEMLTVWGASLSTSTLQDKSCSNLINGLNKPFKGEQASTCHTGEPE